MKGRRSLALLLGSGVLALSAALAGCQQNGPTTSVTTAEERNLSGVALEGDVREARPVDYVPRERFSITRSEEDLTFPLDQQESRNFLAGFEFWVRQHTALEGTGPLHNQRRCLGCHTNTEDNLAMLQVTNYRNPLDIEPAVITVATTAGRASRQGITEYTAISENQRPPTNAFTLFGDFDPVSGEFLPIMEFGGPLLHVKVFGEEECSIEFLPPQDIDVHLRPNIDPVTGEVTQRTFRAVGERAGPPYIGRGLMEAVYAPDLERNSDLADTSNASSIGGVAQTMQSRLQLLTQSSLEPAVDPVALGCQGDCISGRINLGRVSDMFQGGDPVVRVGRFGLRAAGPALLAFILGGMSGEIGLTTPLTPNEQPNYNNVGLECDTVPDPELTLEAALNVRSVLRLLAPPEFAPELCHNRGTRSDNSEQVALVQRGAELFGLDLDAFCSRVIPGENPTGSLDDDTEEGYLANRGMSADAGLGCAICHTPILRTGVSPAEVGARHLSNRWAPIFSDLLLHHVGQYPLGVTAETLRPLPAEIATRSDGTPIPLGDPDCQFRLTASGYCQREGWISRNMADFALPGQGLANGNEFRTPPLMGIGRVGPPHMHDARIFVNPRRPGWMLYTNRDVVNRPFQLLTPEDALRAAIEIHDLPAPPGNDYANCPQVPYLMDICSRNSPNRSEARNTIEKWHNLTPQDQLAVIRFLQAL